MDLEAGPRPAELSPPTPTTLRVRVLVWERADVQRAGLQAVLQTAKDLQVVAHPDAPDPATLGKGRFEADVHLVSVAPRETGALAAVTALSSAGGRVMVLGQAPLAEESLEAFRAGAMGYLGGAAPPHRLLHAIRCLARGEIFLDPQVAVQLLPRLGQPAAERPAGVVDPTGQLTERQLVVAYLVAEGLNNEQIADQLRISLATVKSHVAAILQRLGLRNRTQVAILLGRDGTPPSP